MHGSTLKMTKHACARVRQRCIPPLIMEWLDSFGARTGDGHGAKVLYFDKESRKCLMKMQDGRKPSEDESCWLFQELACRQCRLGENTCSLSFRG